MTLRQIQAFLAVAESGTFTKAAARLNIAQPALSLLVRELERELKIRLFDRTTRRVELTEGGREFQSAASKIMRDLELAVRNAGDLASRRRGHITVAAPPFLAAAILPGAITKLEAEHPGLQVTIVDTRTDVILKAVRHGQADYGLGTFAATERDLARTPLARDELMMFCGTGHRLARRRKVAWKDLSGQPLITLTRDSGIRTLVEVGYESAQIPLQPAYEVAQITTALALVQAGHGITVLPAYAQATAPRHDLATAKLGEPVISRNIELVRADGRSVSPAMAAFETALKHCLRRFASRLA